jgi:hypothetical protein
MLPLFLGYSAHRVRLQVLYLDVIKDSELDKLLDLTAAVRAHYVEAGITDSTGDRPFAPHVTIAKLSNLVKRGSGPRIRSIPEAMPFLPAPISAAVMLGCVATQCLGAMLAAIMQALP